MCYSYVCKKGKLKVSFFEGQCGERNGYNYGNFIHLKRDKSSSVQEINFSGKNYQNKFHIILRCPVRGSSDAHILLSDGCGCPSHSDYCDADNCQGYEIVIGGQNNRIALNSRLFSCE